MLLLILAGEKFSYDPYRGVNVLLSQNISRSSAKQRAGRAGRTSNGSVFVCGPNPNITQEWNLKSLK